MSVELPVERGGRHSTNEMGNETYASSGAWKSGRKRNLSAPGAMKPSGSSGASGVPGEPKPLTLGARKPSEVREAARPLGTEGNETLGGQWRVRWQIGNCGDCGACGRRRVLMLSRLAAVARCAMEGRAMARRAMARRAMGARAEACCNSNHARGEATSAETCRVQH